jgi:hypothetical protein
MILFLLNLKLGDALFVCCNSDVGCLCGGGRGEIEDSLRFSLPAQVCAMHCRVEPWVSGLACKTYPWLEKIIREFETITDDKN